MTSKAIGTMKIDKKIAASIFLLFVWFSLCLCGYFPRQSRAAEQDLWRALKKENHFALLRHALAPGTGDPVDFNVKDCATQRNLSAKGRDQARNIGKRFRQEGIHNAEVFSSQWCRCIETAVLLDLGPVQELELLNSFFSRMENKDKQTAALRDWIGQKEIRTPLILVTHQVNITALTDIFPGSGEMVVLRKDLQNKLSVLGTIAFE